MRDQHEADVGYYENTLTRSEVAAPAATAPAHVYIYT